MKQNCQLVVIYVILSIFLGVFNYFVTLNFYFSIILFALSMLLSIILLATKQEKAELKEKRTLECVSFINMYILAFDRYKNHEETLNKISDSFSSSLQEQTALIKHLNSIEKLEYLEKYFKLNVYKVFIGIIKDYKKEDGSILTVCQNLFYDLRKIEENVLDFNQLRKRKLIEFGLFWGLTYLIVATLRYTLGDFFLSMIELDFLPIGFFIFNIVFIISLSFFMFKYFDFDFIKGDFNIEKAKRKNRKPKSKLQK